MFNSDKTYIACRSLGDLPRHVLISASEHDIAPTRGKPPNSMPAQESGASGDDDFHMVSTTPPMVKPAPVPSNRTASPRLMRPEARPRCKAVGSEAPTWFP